MRITNLGHACLLVESASATVMIDPGGYTPSFEEERGVDAVLVTHRHGDHLSLDRVPRLMAFNPQASLTAETGACDDLREADLECDVLEVGTSIVVGDLTIEVVGGVHAEIHPDLPALGNVGLLVRNSKGTTLFHPGDSYADVPVGVDVLALPLMAPWATLGETVEFLRAVGASRWIPIHDALLSDVGRTGYLANLERLGPAGAELLDLADGVPVEV